MSRGFYFDRKGQPIDSEKWAELRENRDYSVVMQTPLDNGFWVSTVWLGMNHGFGSTVPIVFETMVFEINRGCRKLVDMSDLPGWTGPPSWTYEQRIKDFDQKRYATEEEALAGHQRMVAFWHHMKPAKAPWCPAIRGPRIPRKLKKRLKKNPEMWARYFPDRPLGDPADAPNADAGGVVGDGGESDSLFSSFEGLARAT